LTLLRPKKKGGFYQMKKIVGIIAAAALATSAFAEVNVGNWNRGVFVPFHYDGDTLRSFEGPSWAVGTDGGIRTGLSFSASTENAGFAMDIHGNPGASIGIGDNAYAFVKPVDMLTVKFGKIDNNLGRLDHCFGTWDYSRFSIERGEGLAGVERQKGLGAEITLEPVEGLIIDYEANFGYDDNHAYDVLWESSSTMIGYKGDFGFVRAIINGQQAQKYKFSDDDTKPAAVIGLAADINAVENLTLKFGASVPTNLTGGTADVTTKTTYPTNSYYLDSTTGEIKLHDGATGTKSETVDGISSFGAIKAAVAADYTLDALAFHAQVGLDVLPKSVNDDNDALQLGYIGVNAGVGVDFAFNDVWKLVTDVRFQSYTNKTDDYVFTFDGKDCKYGDAAFGAYLGLQQQLTNATFAFGAQFGKRSMTSKEADDFTFAVPLTITASF